MAYLEDFKAALKPGGTLLLLEHNPENGVTVREGAFLSSVMMGKVMKMPVVPQDALIEEVNAAGWKPGKDAAGRPANAPFTWPYFVGTHFVGGDGRGYGVLLSA